MEEGSGTMRKGFRHRDPCLTAAASGRDGAAQGFRDGHPDANGGALGYSPCRSEKEREQATEPRIGDSPAGSAWTGECSGRKPEGYGDLFLYVPEARQIVQIAEGTGDNLLEEDTDAGYVDYIYYDQYMLDAGMPDAGGGMILLKERLREKYGCLADCIPDVLEMAYSSRLVGCTVLG